MMWWPTCNYNTCTRVRRASFLVLLMMGAWSPKHVEWLCRNKTCTVLQQVGVLFDLDLTEIFVHSGILLRFTGWLVRRDSRQRGDFRLQGPILLKGPMSVNNHTVNSYYVATSVEHRYFPVSWEKSLLSNQFLFDPMQCYPPIDTQFFQVTYFLEVSIPKPLCTTSTFHTCYMLGQSHSSCLTLWR